MRCPNSPLMQINTLSPGSMKFTKAVSMPALPVPEMGMVSSLAVPNTCCSICLVAFMIPRNSGSRWPMVGIEKARSTLG
jgi:hypothetical protein